MNRTGKKAKIIDIKLTLDENTAKNVLKREKIQI
jgi:hypothetical protein